jgi:hypothetical protein
MQSTMASIMAPAWQNVISLNSSLKVLFRRLLFKLSVHLRQTILARLPISSHLEWILFRQSEFVAFARRNSTLMGKRWDKTVSHSPFIGYYFRGLSCSYSDSCLRKPIHWEVCGDLDEIIIHIKRSFAHCRLARYIWALRYGEDVTETDEHQHATMLAMVDKWSSKFDLKQPASSNVHTPGPVSHIIVRFKPH